MGFGFGPLARRHFPFPGGLAQDEEVQFASSFGKWPRMRTARRSLALSASIAFVITRSENFAPSVFSIQSLRIALAPSALTPSAM